MNPLNLKNNALFLSCWYERSRPVPLICFGLLLGGIMLLTLMSVTATGRPPVEIWQSVLNAMMSLQSLVLIVQGSLFAASMASREQILGTLDFHRNSPEPVAAKIFGLLFGSTWFEWGIFLLLFACSLPFVLVTEPTVGQVMLFNFSLALSGILFHTAAATFALLTTRDKRRSSLGIVLVFLLVAGPVAYTLITQASPYFSHVLGVTAWQYAAVGQKTWFNGWFYTFDLPLIILQAMAQIPLVLLMINGMKRTFCLPNSPAWSKPNVLRFFGFVLFMITGFFVANLGHIEHVLQQKYSGFKDSAFELFLASEVGVYIFVYAVIGVLVSLFGAPTYFQRVKYIVQWKKGLRKGKSLLDDGASSCFAIGIYIFIGGVLFMPYAVAVGAGGLNAALSFLLLSSYILTFAGFLEFFRLSGFRKNKIFFVSATLFWLVFLPWMLDLTLIHGFRRHPVISAVAPAYGIEFVLDSVTKGWPIKLGALLGPFLTTVLMWVLAGREQGRVKEAANRQVHALQQDDSLQSVHS